MNKYPYIPKAMNDLFKKEKSRVDYLLLRPILLIIYFFLRVLIFPIKFLIHRRPLGFEGRSIDCFLAFGLKYLASHEAAELLIRHIQIEPLIYRFLLKNFKNNNENPGADVGNEMDNPDYQEATNNQKLNGIEGDFSVLSFKEMIANSMTIGHDELSYEVADRFERDVFLKNLSKLRKEKPEDHNKYSKKILEFNKKSSSSSSSS